MQMQVIEYGAKNAGKHVVRSNVCNGTLVTTYLQDHRALGKFKRISNFFENKTFVSIKYNSIDVRDKNREVAKTERAKKVCRSANARGVTNAGLTQQVKKDKPKSCQAKNNT